MWMNREGMSDDEPLSDNVRLDNIEVARDMLDNLEYVRLGVATDLRYSDLSDRIRMYDKLDELIRYFKSIIATGLVPKIPHMPMNFD